MPSDSTKAKIDPYDIDALERSLNDSATRVSAVWLSFVIFALYLALAATTTTHRQLLLDQPIKLPVLDVELPIFGFYLVAPILFLLFHFYVLLQVLLLNRTAAAYNCALNMLIKSPSANSLLRQRLANTLFAQIFAGSTREREGIVGVNLRIVSWMTLVVIPIIVLVIFQVSFLPYQSFLVTWCHRLIVALELVMLVSLWPLITDASKDLDLKETFFRPLIVFAFLPIVTLVFVVTFPDEPQIRPFYFLSKQFDPCDQGYLAGFNRLDVSRQVLINTDRLLKIEAAGREQGLAPHEGERTLVLSNRSLMCGGFDGVDLRRADLREANLRGADLDNATLQGAELSDANLEFASLAGAKLDDANLDGAHAADADFGDASLRGASLNRIGLQGATLIDADLQGASLEGAALHAANFNSADLRAASLRFAFLIGAEMYASKLDGASFNFAQAADLTAASLIGTNLSSANLQGVLFHQDEQKVETILTDAWIYRAAFWHTDAANCRDAMVISPRFDAILSNGPFGDVNATNEQIEKNIAEAVTQLPVHSDDRERFEKRLRDAVAEHNEEQQKQQASWKACSSETVDLRYIERLASYLAGLSCAERSEERYRIHGIYRNWIHGVSSGDPAAPIASRLSTLLLDETKCPGGKVLSDREKSELRIAKAWTNSP